MSMMTEACATGRPVHLFDTGVGRLSMHERARAEPTALSLQQRLDPRQLHGFLYRQTLRFGPRRLTRDIRIIQRRLVASGRAVWLGEGSPSSSPPRLEDVPNAVARVRALFGASADSRLPERNRVTRPADGRADPGARRAMAGSARAARSRRGAGGCGASPRAAALSVTMPRSTHSRSRPKKKRSWARVRVPHVAAEQRVVAEPLAALAHQPGDARDRRELVARHEVDRQPRLPRLRPAPGVVQQSGARR